MAGNSHSASNSQGQIVCNSIRTYWAACGILRTRRALVNSSDPIAGDLDGKHNLAWPLDHGSRLIEESSLHREKIPSIGKLNKLIVLAAWVIK